MMCRHYCGLVVLACLFSVAQPFSLSLCHRLPLRSKAFSHSSSEYVSPFKTAGRTTHVRGLSRASRAKAPCMQLPPDLASVDFSSSLAALSSGGLAITGMGGSVGFVLGLLGGGGSILALPIFLYILHEPAQSAIAESLLVVSIGAGVGLLAKLKSVNMKEILPLATSAMLGSAAMAQYSKAVPESFRLGLFTIFCVTSSVNMIQSSQPKAKQPSSPSEDAKQDHSFEQTSLAASTDAAPAVAQAQQLAVLSAAINNDDQALASSSSNQPQLLGLLFLVGCLTSLIGAGGGFIVVPILTLVGNIPMESAVGSSLLIICLNSFSGFASMQRIVEVHYDITAPFAAAVSIGAVLGSAQAKKISQAALKQLFGSIVLLACASVLAMTLPPLLSHLH